MPERWVLEQYRHLPLTAKVHMSQARIREWYDHWQGDVYVSFSGGKDSTVLAHLVHDLYPRVPLVFSNTGLEYPEIQAFARKMGAEFVRPKMQFSEVISKYGYPLISKENSNVIACARSIRGGQRGNPRNTGYHRKDLLGTRDQKTEMEGKGTWEDWRRKSLKGKLEVKYSSFYNKTKWLPLCNDTQFLISNRCCDVMKKSPIKAYQKKNGGLPYIGTLTEESKLRESAWIQHGCNAFDAKKKTSQPMSFWTEQDVLHYIRDNQLEIASVYGDIVGVDQDGMQYEPMPGCDCNLKCTGCQRTGCVFCGFGVHLEKGETRFQRLARTHPKQYEYCMKGGQWVDNPKYDPAAPVMDGDWKNWNPKKIWVPSKEGLGMKKVFDDCNQIYGKGFIRYE